MTTLDEVYNLLGNKPGALWLLKDSVRKRGREYNVIIKETVYPSSYILHRQKDIFLYSVRDDWNVITTVGERKKLTDPYITAMVYFDFDGNTIFFCTNKKHSITENKKVPPL